MKNISCSFVTGNEFNDKSAVFFADALLVSL